MTPPLRRGLPRGSILLVRAANPGRPRLWAAGNFADGHAMAFNGGMTRDGRPPRDGAAPPMYGVTLAVVWAALALPPLLARFPPLHDYPNHVARAFLLAHLGQLPQLQQHYALRWLPYPNLAFDLIAMPACWLLDAHLVGRIFLALLPGWFLFGADRLSRALHGRPSALVPLVGFFFYNTVTLYGFLSYGFGVGLYLVVFAVWLEDRRAPSRHRGLWLVVGAFACHLAHATAWLFLAVSVVVALSLDGARGSARVWLRHAGFLLPPLLLAALSGLSTLAGELVWDDGVGKLKGIGSLVALYHPTWDAITTLMFVAAVVLFVRRGEARIDRPALAIAAVFGVLFLIAPSQIGGTWAADRRLLLPAATLALSSLRAEPLDRPRGGVWMIAFALVLLRAGSVAAAWPGLSRDIEQRVALLQAVPAGSRLFGFALVDRDSKATWSSQMGLVHAHDWVVVDRAAFSNGLFAKLNQQPLRERAPSPPPDPPPARDVSPALVDWQTIFGHHQYVFATKWIASYRDFLRQRCEIVAEAGDAGLYRACRIDPGRP
jgi:hypothetical protein